MKYKHLTGGLSGLQRIRKNRRIGKLVNKEAQKGKDIQKIKGIRNMGEKGTSIEEQE